MSNQRLNTYEAEPQALPAILGLENVVRQGPLPERLRNLVKIRASQINGCAYCLDMHTREAMKEGEDMRRVHVLSAWREAPQLFTERELAAIELTECVTRIGEAGVPDPVWSRVRAQFDDRETAHLLLAICAINVWNRIAVTTHADLLP